MTRAMGRAALALAAASLLVAGCERNRRTLREKPAVSTRPDGPAIGALQAGPQSPPRSLRNPYEGNAYAISEGQRLYTWYNCTGCHFRGGGGIGPPLMDDLWIYGGDPGNIFDTIVQGRPNGMPSWRGKIPEYQIWQIVAYVQSMDASQRIASPPGAREEHLQASEGKPSR